MQRVFEQGYFKGEDEGNLYYQYWSGKSERIKENLLILHGLAEHTGRYAEFCEYFSKEGYNIFIYDLRGHGRSEGLRGDISSFEIYIRDTERFFRFLEDRYGVRKKQVILFGHSMGGTIAIHYTALNPGLKGLVLSSPFFGLYRRVHPLKYYSAKLMKAIFPTLLVPNEIDPSLLSHDSEKVRLYEVDPMIFKKVSLRWFFEVEKGIREAKDAARKIEIPVIFMVAGDDRIVSIGKSKEIFYLIPASDKSIKVYDGYFHEIFNEEMRDVVREDLLAWLNKRCG